VVEQWRGWFAYGRHRAQKSDECEEDHKTANAAGDRSLFLRLTFWRLCLGLILAQRGHWILDRVIRNAQLVRHTVLASTRGLPGFAAQKLQLALQAAHNQENPFRSERRPARVPAQRRRTRVRDPRACLCVDSLEHASRSRVIDSFVLHGGLFVAVVAFLGCSHHQRNSAPQPPSTHRCSAALRCLGVLAGGLASTGALVRCHAAPARPSYS
jgi:hypothetical protein